MVRMVVLMMWSSQSHLELIMVEPYRIILSLKVMNMAMMIDYEINAGDGEFAELIKELIVMVAVMIMIVF